MQIKWENSLPVSFSGLKPEAQDCLLRAQPLMRSATHCTAVRAKHTAPTPFPSQDNGIAAQGEGWVCPGFMLQHAIDVTVYFPLVIWKFFFILLILSSRNTNGVFSAVKHCCKISCLSWAAQRLRARKGNTWAWASEQLEKAENVSPCYRTCSLLLWGERQPAGCVGSREGQAQKLAMLRGTVNNARLSPKSQWVFFWRYLLPGMCPTELEPNPRWNTAFQCYVPFQFILPLSLFSSFFLFF